MAWARGIEGRKIFLNTKDRNDFIARLKHLAEDQSIAIYTWALVDNHFHLLCKTNKRPLSSSMRKLLAVKELGYSCPAVARYLGVANSCVTRVASGNEIPQKETYI
jgi:phage FluMu gp28-like protein